MSKKRTLHESQCSLSVSTEQPSFKRQKLYSFECKSHWFPNKHDQQQYQDIYQTIYSSPLPNDLQISSYIVKNIAEYATGQFIECDNTKCTNKISILFHDKQIYNDDHNNANKVGYKWDYNKYYCSNCMDKAVTCKCCETTRRCKTLSFISDSNKCCKCQWFFCECKCRCRKCGFNNFKCSNCENKYCSKCCLGMKTCQLCTDIFCESCSIIKNDNPVCLKCYNEIIQCNTCNYKMSIQRWYDLNKECAMRKCDGKNCKVFICFKCDDNARNGVQVICDVKQCKYEIGIYCNKHANEAETLCFNHYKRSKVFNHNKRSGTINLPYNESSECNITYEKAIHILLNENCCFGVYDKKTKAWRTAIFFQKWDETKRLSVRFITDSERGGEKYFVIKDFPVNYIKNDFKLFNVTEEDLKNFSNVSEEKINEWIKRVKYQQ